MTMWFHNLLGYEFEVSMETGTYTGWSRAIGGWLADGRWPERNDKTGDTRYSRAPNGRIPPPRRHA